MSLTGTLADLALSELLQMIALTGKSGVLQISSQPGTAWIGFRTGAIARVARSDRGLERKQILVDAGLDPEGEGQEIDDCLHEAASNALLDLFDWTAGSFEFDTAADPEATWPGPEGLHLGVRISPQFLALEGARLGDERSEATPVASAAPPEPAPEQSNRLPGAPTLLIVIDQALELLEAIKSGLADTELRIHIFQRPGDGLTRFKQYLLRGEVPALVLGAGVVDPVSPNRGASPQAFAQRARSLAPRVGVVLLAPKEVPPPPAIDAVVCRPEPDEVTQDAMRDFVERLRRALGATA